MITAELLAKDNKIKLRSRAASVVSPLSVAEIVTVLFLILMSVWSVRPLVEEWGIFLAFERHGLGYIVSSLPGWAMRPLLLVPFALQWIVAGGNTIGIGIFTGILLLTRYLIVRWAVMPIIAPTERWVFATLATTLVSWPGLWLARFSAAQISAIMLFIAVGCSIRLCLRPSMLYSVISAVAVIGFMTIYQAPVFVAATLPFIAYAWVPEGAGFNMRSRITRFLRVGIPLLAGIFLYVLYAVVAYVNFGTGYEGGLYAGAVYSGGAILNLTTAYATVFLTNQLTLPILSFVLCAVLLVSGRGDRYDRSKVAIFAFLAMAFLPLLSLPYLSVLHLRDPERTLFPVVLGFCIIVMCVFGSRHLTETRQTALGPAGLIVLALLSSSLVGTVDARNAWSFQKTVMLETRKAMEASGANKVLIHDETGLLGDVYTFFGPSSLTDALLFQGVDADILICTADNVDRLHYVAQRFPIPTTPRCTEADSEGRTPFTASMVLGEFAITP